MVQRHRDVLACGSRSIGGSSISGRYVPRVVSAVVWAIGAFVSLNLGDFAYAQTRPDSSSASKVATLPGASVANNASAPVKNTSSTPKNVSSSSGKSPSESISKSLNQAQQSHPSVVSESVQQPTDETGVAGDSSPAIETTPPGGGNSQGLQNKGQTQVTTDTTDAPSDDPFGQGARAESRRIRIFPTMIWASDPGGGMQMRLVLPTDGAAVHLAREVDSSLRDAAYDLGFGVDLTSVSSVTVQEASEQSMLTAATERDQWVLSPQIRYEARRWVLRFVLVPARQNYAIVRQQAVVQGDVQLGAVVMFRDLIRVAQGKGEIVPRAEPQVDGPVDDETSTKKGKPALVINAAVLGGFIGYSLQKSSGSNDVRLTYPLMAVGAGLGAGASLLAAQEWPIGVGDAWYLSAAMWWPTFGSWMVATSANVQPSSDRYGWAVGGSLAGLAMGTLSLTLGRISSTGAILAHSGGLIGTSFGVGIEFAVRASTSEIPYHGLGYGALGGVLIGGVLGRFVNASQSRVMMVDLGVGLGALGFAAIGSPLLIADKTKGRERGWALVTLGGAVTGGVVAFLLTRPVDEEKKTSKLTVLTSVPIVGPIAYTEQQGKKPVPAYGVGWTGTF